MCLFAIVALAQQADKKSDANRPDWTLFKSLIGQWKGQGSGEPGNSVVERSYKLGIGGTFLVGDNRSVYPPQKANPSGETHVNHDLIGFDRLRKKYVMRQFHSEGFVNQYVLDEIAPDGKKLVWVTEAIENIASGWRARETYLVKNDNEFTEIFELSPPGKDFQLYVRNGFRRVK